MKNLKLVTRDRRQIESKTREMFCVKRHAAINLVRQKEIDYTANEKLMKQLFRRCQISLRQLLENNFHDKSKNPLISFD